MQLDQLKEMGINDRHRCRQATSVKRNETKRLTASKKQDATKTRQQNTRQEKSNGGRMQPQKLIERQQFVRVQGHKPQMNYSTPTRENNHDNSIKIVREWCGRFKFAIKSQTAKHHQEKLNRK